LDHPREHCAPTLLVGRTLIIEQQVILDAAVRRHDHRWSGQCHAGGAVLPGGRAVYLERESRRLPELPYVSVTDEALKRELAQRWFASQPQIKLG
jgi:hypothetical protein